MKLLFSNFSVLTNSHVISTDGEKHNFAFEISSLENGTLIGHVTHKHGKAVKDDVGAFYYVVVVMSIYSLSILMIIASYIRKNKSDRKLNRYLKEMANLRKREFQMQLYNIAARRQRAAESAKKTGSGDNIEDRDRNSGNVTDYMDRLKYIQDVKPKRLHAYSPKNAKMVLELPSCTYTTDSDIETSTEGEFYPSPSHGRLEERVHFSARRDSIVSFMTDPGDTVSIDSSPRRRSSLRRPDVGRDVTSGPETLRRSSLTAHQERLKIASGATGFKVAVMRTRSLDASKDLIMAQKIALSRSENGKFPSALSKLAEPSLTRQVLTSSLMTSQLATTSSSQPQASQVISDVTSQRPQKVYRVVIPETELKASDGRQTPVSDL